MNLPAFPTWLTTIQCCTICLYIITFTQAVRLLYVHIRAKQFTLVSFCQLGLIRIEFPSMMALLHFFYAPLVIFDLIFLQLVNARHIGMSGEIILFGCKFLLIEIGSWCFVWVCASQCAGYFYTSPSDFSTSAHKRHGRTINPIVRWCANTSFLAVILISVLFVGYHYVRANNEYNSAKRILHATVGELHSRAAMFNPQTYSPLILLQVLRPASEIIPHAHRFAQFTRIGIIYHLSLLIFLSVTYLPTLWISVYWIHAQSKLEKKLCAPLEEMTGEVRVKLSRTVSNARSQRRTVVWQAAAWFSGTFVSVFILVAQLSFKGDGYLQNKMWIALTYIGLHLPEGVLSNIILFTLTRSTIRRYAQSDANLVYERSLWLEEGERFTAKGPNPSTIFSPPTLMMKEGLLTQDIHSQLAEHPLIALPMSTYKTNLSMDTLSQDCSFNFPDRTLQLKEQYP